MTQEAIQITETPPLPGVKLVQDMNKALLTVATDFAGLDDPAAKAGPYMTWADTATLTRKRRNAANSAWVIEGRLFRSHLPIIPFDEIPTTDIGQISVVTKGIMEWDGAAYAAVNAVSADDMQWLGTPIGGYVTPHLPPPKDDPRFRYVLCTAGQTGAGGYNDGVLVNESVTGSGALIIANADISLAGSPMHGANIPLINTDDRFVGAGTAEALENDSIQNFTGHFFSPNGASWSPSGSGAFASESAGTSTDGGANLRNFYENTFDPSRVARTSDHTQPRAHRLPHYRRIL